MNRTVSMSEGGVETLDAVLDVMSRAFPVQYGEAWTRGQCLGILGMPGVWLTTAHEGEGVIGFALARIVLDEAELLLLAVDPVRRRRGIGAALLDRTTVLARTKGAQRLYLEVREGNEARALYMMRGFQEVGRRRGYYRGKDGQLFDAVSLSYVFDNCENSIDSAQ